MNKYLKMIFFGLLVWLVPFVVSFFIYPLKTAGNPLFESIMPVTLTVIVVALAYLYLKNLETGYTKEGVMIGVIWFVISIAIDLVMFLPPNPMQMTLKNYMMDVGITYLMIPIITFGMGYLLDSKV
ncbi:hypothetical protein [Methanobacterium petrolearium]|uniref:hypothetical protein n=1 Tax=Methanobacterium petrolearium TaxID=710190 RepID=UPI001AE3B0D0|nr:hypothetical protein [Methanobacterium petrolearium]MBP1945844.1 hypothetical protein [Methanobacterium petrolearium]BDZ69606.1 hypothetical protein GCM10025861_01230 [Methanobacterium petrolearium]